MPYLSTETQSLGLQALRFVRLWIDYFIEFCFWLYHRNSKQTVPPITNPHLLLSATKLAEKIRKRELSTVEVVQMHIDRIKEVNGIINAVVDTRFDKALEEAAKVDADIRDGVITEEDFKRKPLLGVPFTSKESTHCKGMRASFGLFPRKDVLAEEDADVIKYMKASGAILIGVTNIPQLNLWVESHNPIYGITRNPYNTTRNVGGSSGGEGAIITACGSPIGVGTDIGGSIRIPSYMCGVFGHKPSPCLTETRGLTYRDGSDNTNTMVAAGPMARHSEDLIPGLKAILGPAHEILKLDDEVDIRKLKYYFVYDSGDPLMSTPRADVIQAMEKVVKHYQEIAQVEELKIKELKYVASLYRYWLFIAGNFPFDVTGRTREPWSIVEFLKYLIGRSEFSFSAIMGLLNFRFLPSVNEKWAVDTTNTLKNTLLDKLGDNAVLLYMSSQMVAQHHHMSYLQPFNFSNFCLFSLLKLPATQVPLGLNSEGLPLGIQVASATNMDRLSLAVAKDLEATFGGHVNPFPTEK